MSGNNRNRRNWTRSLTVVSLIAAAGAVIGCLATGGAVNADRVYLQNTAGAVLFDHGKHGSLSESCAECHHTLYGASQATACDECHNDGFSADDISHVRLKEIHNRECSTCHEQSIDNEQAVSCRKCHPAMQQSDTRTNSCTECHDDSYSPDMMEHDEFLDIADHSCLGCHSPGSVSEVYHTNCSHCHLETAPDRFAKAGGEVACGACHLR